MHALKRSPIEVCNGEARGPIRPHLKTHPHDRWDGVMLLSVVGELLRKHVAEVDAIDVRRSRTVLP